MTSTLLPSVAVREASPPRRKGEQASGHATASAAGEASPDALADTTGPPVAPTTRAAAEDNGVDEIEICRATMRLRIDLADRLELRRLLEARALAAVAVANTLMRESARIDLMTLDAFRRSARFARGDRVRARARRHAEAKVELLTLEDPARGIAAETFEGLRAELLRARDLRELGRIVYEREAYRFALETARSAVGGGS